MRTLSVSNLGWAQPLGLAGIVLFALFAFLGTAVAYMGLGLMLVSMLADGQRAGRALKRDPVFLTALAFSVYTIVRAIIAAWQFPELAEAQQENIWHWLAPFLFLTLAWWTRGDTRRIIILLALTLTGLVLGVVRQIDWQRLPAFLDGARANFGMTALDSGLFLGVALLGWIALAPRLIGNGPWRRLRLAGWIVLVALLVEMLFINQTRSVWGSLAVLVPALIITRICMARNDPRARRRYTALAGCALLALAALGFFNRGVIVERLSHEHATIHALVTLQWDDVPYTSVGARFHLYRFGLQKWLERPVFGWGPGTEAAVVFEGAPVFPRSHTGFSHLHNGYLEILVRFGAVGFVLLVITAGLLIRAFWRAWRSGKIPNDLALFFAAASILAALTNLTDFRLVHLPYRFFTILLVGLVYGYTLAAPGGALGWVRQKNDLLSNDVTLRSDRA